MPHAPASTLRALAPVRAAARDVVDPAHLRAALRVTPAEATLAPALRCGAAVALALVVPALLGRPDLSAFASLGALTSLYGRHDPYRRRASLLAGVGLLMTATVAAFSLLAALGVPDLVLLAGVAALAAGTTAICLLVRTGPPGATIVVFAAGAALAGAPGLGDAGLRAGATALGAAIAWVVCMAGVLTRVSGRTRPSERSPEPSTERTTLRAQARANLAGPWRLATGRVAVAGVVAAAAASVAGLGHPAWATMGSTAVLQGTSTRHAVVRALQRGAGTVAGALLAWPLLAAPLGFWGTAAIVVVLQTVTEVVVGRHYGLAMLTITPMALLMTSLAHPANPGALALDRALDTVLGAVVGVLAVVVVHPRTRPTQGPSTAR
jgi:uncharacterized membrane protein YccC